MGKKKKKLQKPATNNIQSLYKPLMTRKYLFMLFGVAGYVFTILILISWWLTQQSKAATEHVSFPPLDLYKEQVLEKEPEPKISAIPPSKKADAQEPPFLTAKAAVVMDVASEAILFSKDEKTQLWPASTTKVMTALVVLDSYNLEDIVEIKSPISDGSRMGLIEGEKITVENLLYGLLIQSANDAAYALASYHVNGAGEFVGLMNQKATEIGLENTHFIDPAGFDNQKQFTTASDLAKLALVAMKNRTIAKMVGIPQITVSDTDYIHFHKLRTVNQLLGSVPGVAGIKTGQTENAKENLINLTKRDGKEILTVILGSDDRFGETKTLTFWSFDNFEWPVLVE